jgi:hypothetical protein
MSWAL